MEGGEILILLVMLVAAVAPVLLTWKDRKDPETKKAVAATSLLITVSRFFDKNDWGSK